MEQTYSQHHLESAHHAGLVIGTIVGSCAVTLLAVIAVAITSPKAILHPLSFTSQLGVQSDNNQATQTGIVASQTDALFAQSRQGSAGLLGGSTSSDLSH